MDQLGTVLILAQDAAEWADTVDLLSNQSGYRVLAVRSAGDANSALADAHVDLVIAEDGGSGDGLAFLSELRISHPEMIRSLAPRTARSRRSPRPASFAKTSISACAASSRRCPPCARGPTIFQRSRSSSPPSTATRSDEGCSASPPARLTSSRPTSSPANARELENEIRRMVALAKDGGSFDDRSSCRR